MYIYTKGSIKRKDNTLVFIDYEGKKRDYPVERVSDIYVMEEMELNTALLNFAGANGIAIHFFNYYSFYTGTFHPRETMPAGALLIKQCLCYEKQDERLAIAKEFVDAASYNIYRNLRYYNGRGKDLRQYMEEIDYLRKQIVKMHTVPELMGVEGNIHKVYYSAWNSIIEQKINFEKRVKNPPDNMINTLISFVNSLIYTRVLSEIYKTQLNPTISFLHEPGVRRFSLCLDIAEIFKPLIGDRIIFSLLNRNQITEKSFTRELNYLHLTKEASMLIARALDERFETAIMHQALEKKVSYQYLMRLECYKLIKHIIGEKNYEGFKIWW